VPVRLDLRTLAGRLTPGHGILAASGLALVVHALHYGFVTDDAYISFVYARNLAEHGELAFNPGLPPVEGYTNFLWTVLLALVHRVGLPSRARRSRSASASPWPRWSWCSGWASASSAP
jgi:hypothetical protein